MWHYGDKHASQRYEATVELKSAEESVLFRAHIPVFPLISISTCEILETKKGTFISSSSLESLGFFSGKVFLDVKILPTENI